MRWKIFLIGLLLIIPFGIIVKGESLKLKFMASNVLSFLPTQIPEQNKIWTLLDKIDERDDLLESTELKVGDKNIIYYENRITKNNDKISVTKRQYKEPEKEIALKLLNMTTGEVSVIKIVKRGAELINSQGYKIEIEERSSGIRWNKWGTQYKVLEPPNHIVLKNKYPEVEYKTVKKTVKSKSGGKRVVYEKQKIMETFIYSSYNESLHTPEIIEAARAYLISTVDKTTEELRRRGIKSRAFPEKLVVDVDVLPPDFFRRIPLLEQTDLGEFLENPRRAAERVLVLIGTNKQNSFSKTCSKARACGWVQFTNKGTAKKPGTYTMIVRAYPEAQLIKDFEKGAADHLNSMMAAILLYDHNLAGFVKKHGKKILEDGRLEEYLAGAYNGGSARVSNSLKVSVSVRAKISDWTRTKHLESETKGFITKLRFLKENNLP